MPLVFCFRSWRMFGMPSKKVSQDVEDQPPIYRLPKPTPNGRTQLRLTPLQLLDRLAALIPPPRVHRRRSYGVLAPNAPWRAQVTAVGGWHLGASAL